jgi:hypothetical protein
LQHPHHVCCHALVNDALGDGNMNQECDKEDVRGGSGGAEWESWLRRDPTTP